MNAPVRQFELTEKVQAYDPDADVGLIDAAYVLAAQSHGAQTRDNGDPYITHPVAVADILAGFRLDAHSIITGLLHDTIEDTPLTLDAIVRRFGPDVASLVDGVTKLTRLELNSDRTKQAENFRKLVLAMSRDIRVLLVKLADRLHNMRTMHFARGIERRQRIARETMEIYAPLAERIGMDGVKSELQTLSFAQLDPEAYETIHARLNFLRGQGADVIEEVSADLRRVCEDAGIRVVGVTGREKSPFSIWEKMQRRNVTFEQLSDIMAFRIVVGSREDCYGALGAVHSAFPVIAGRFKDYISTPKSNGYRSLHTGVTLRQPRNQKIEVQIRTPGHGRSGGQGRGGALGLQDRRQRVRRARGDGNKLPWVQDLLEILDNSSAADDFLENTKLELYQDQVFCFTPKGQLIQLPRGATPVDFAYAVHSQVGDTCVGARINGRLIPLRHELQNGDQVEILTARGGTPSPHWEKFVATGKARARIRRYVHAQQREQHIDQGRAALAKAFRRTALDGSEKMLEPALKVLKVASDGRSACRGRQRPDRPARCGARRLPRTASPAARGPPHAAGDAAAPRPRRRQIRTGHGDQRPGGQHGGALRRLLPPPAGRSHRRHRDHRQGRDDPHQGLPDAGKLRRHARTLHRRGMGPPTPDEGPQHPHLGRVSVIAANGANALGAVANAVAKQDGSVTNLKIANRQQDFFEVIVDVEVRDVRHLTNVIAGLRAAAGVAERAERARS